MRVMTGSAKVGIGFDPPQLRDQHYYGLTEPGKRVVPAHDINPRSAVCLTLRIDAAPMFPLNPAYVERQKTYVYGVWMSTGFSTYSLQGGSKLQDAREVAKKIVLAQDILCAIECHRTGGPLFPRPGSNVPSFPLTFKFTSNIIWNPRARPRSPVDIPKWQIIDEFNRFRAHGGAVQVTHNHIVFQRSRLPMFDF